MTRRATVTFAEIVDAEPRLAGIEDDARRAATIPGYCLVHCWYDQDGIKQQLSCLVGWERRRDEWAAADMGNIAELIATEDARRLAVFAEDVAHGIDWLWTSAAYDRACRALVTALEPCPCHCPWWQRKSGSRP